MERITSLPAWACLLARTLATLPFWWSGLAKLVDFSAARAEAAHFALYPPGGAAALIILIQLGASAMLIVGWRPVLAALVLSLFTLVATFMGHAFWSIAEPQARFHELNAFLANLGLIGGLALAAFTALTP